MFHEKDAIMETVRTKSKKKEDLGLDYAFIILIIAFIIGTIARAMYKLNISFF